MPNTVIYMSVFMLLSIFLYFYFISPHSIYVRYLVYCAYQKKRNVTGTTSIQRVRGIFEDSGNAFKRAAYVKC